MRDRRGKGPKTVVASGDRSVAFGGDATGAVVVTGDNNQVFAGNQIRLIEAVIDPASVYERVGLDRFVGREWLDAQVDAMLAEQDRGLFVLEAGAGLGKTAYLAHLARSRDWIQHFVETARGAGGVARGLQNLGAQLIQRYDIPPYARDGVLPASGGSPESLASLVTQAAALRDARGSHEPIVLVVDALDESAAPEGHNVMGLPRVLPRGVYLVCSQRPVAVTLAVEGPPPRIVRLVAGERGNLDDMKEFLRRAGARPAIATALAAAERTPAEFVDTLLDRCRGVWIYLQYVIAGIELGQYKPLDLDALPYGVWQFYAAFWMRWHGAATWKPLVRPLLGLLAAVQEDANVERLCTFGDIADRDAARDFMDGTWRPFLTTVDRPGADRQYRLYHASLREFLDGRVDRDDLTTAQRDVADELAAATREAHARIAARYLTAWGGLDAGLPRLQEPAARDVDGGYGLRHLIEHLVVAGNVLDAKRVLSGEWVSEQPREVMRSGWRGLLDRVLRRKRVVVDRFSKNAWFAAKGGTADLAGYLTDQQRAWRGAETESERAIAAGEPARSIALEVRCALAIASLNDVAGNVGPQLLDALVRQKIIAATTAFAYAIQSPEPAQRMHALMRVAGWLDEPRRSEACRSALAALLQVPRHEVEAALEALPSGIPDDLLREIVGAIRSPGDDGSFTAGRQLARLVPALSEPVLEEVVAFAAGLEDQGIAVLAAAAARSQPPARSALVARLMQQVKLTEYSSPSEVIAPLLGIAADLSPEFRARVIDEARRRLTNPYGFSSVAGPLLRVLDAKTRPEVAEFILQQALDRGDVREAFGVCGPLLALLPDRALGSLDSLARRAGDESARRDLEAFAARFFAETGDREQALRMVEILAPGSGPHYPRPYAEAITSVAARLPASDTPELLRRARTISDPEGRRRALDALTPRLGPAELQAAFEATTRIDDRYYAESAQIDARAVVAPGETADPLEWALDSGWLPGRRLSAVARWLPTDAVPRAVTRARAIRSAESKAEALAGLAAAGAPDAAGLADEMLAAAAAAAADGRINILAAALSDTRLRSILIGNRRTEALRLLLAALRETETVSSAGYRMAEVIAQIAGGLDEPSIRSVLDTASRIASDWPSGKAFQALAPYLPERALRVLAARESSLGARAAAVPAGRGLRSLARWLPREVAAESGPADATEIARLEELATARTTPIEAAAVLLHAMQRAPQNERLADRAAFAILRTDDLDTRLTLLFAFMEAPFRPNRVATGRGWDRIAWNILMAALALPDAPARADTLEELAGYVEPFARAALERAVAALRAWPPERVPPAESVDAVLIDVARLIRTGDAGERAHEDPPDGHHEIPTRSAVVETCAERGGHRGIAALAELAHRLPRAEAESAIAEYAAIVSRSQGYELARFGRSLNALLPSPPDAIVATVTAAMFSPDARERLDPQTAVVLAERMPMETLMVAWRFAATRIGDVDRRRVLGIICRRLRDATPAEAYRHWREILRLSAAGHRVSLLHDLGALSPLIAQLGTSAAVDGTIDAIVNAENWWP